jgi:hypothetical protein
MDGGRPVDRVDIETSGDVINYNIFLRMIHINISAVWWVGLNER